MRPEPHQPRSNCLPWVGFILLFMLAPASMAQEPKCLFVSSYHQGYAWSDGVERGLRNTLQDKCHIRQFNMDTKRKKSPAEKRAAATAAKELIESWRPDVVITADDNAAKYLIQPYYKDSALPFVFCGVNWTAEEYGFPYSNVTGMIEVAPVKAMISEAKALVARASRVIYIGADTSTERKNADRVREAALELGLDFQQRFAGDLQAWITAYRAGQSYDFVIVGSNAGINDWDNGKAFEAIKPITEKLSVTSHGWMMPVSMLGMTKVPEEQGEWAGHVALEILGGAAPDSIPVIANRKWDLFLNPDLIAAAGLELPSHLLSKGKVYRQNSP